MSEQLPGPKDFLRRRRPEEFSDTRPAPFKPRFTVDYLGYVFDQITTDRREFDFENLAYALMQPKEIVERRRTGLCYFLVTSPSFTLKLNCAKSMLYPNLLVIYPKRLHGPNCKVIITNLEMELMEKEMHVARTLPIYMRIVGKQLILIGVALAFFVFPVLTSWYLNRHVIHPCQIEKVLAGTCPYDSVVASGVHWLSESALARFFEGFFYALNQTTGTLAAAVFPHEHIRTVSITASVITLLGLWLGLNVLWALFRLAKKKKADAR